jgi:hypothetical protein
VPFISVQDRLFTEYLGRWNVGFMNVVELRAFSNKDSYPTNDFYYYASDNSDINHWLIGLISQMNQVAILYSFGEQGLRYVITNEKVTNLANSLTIGGLGSKMILKDDVVINFTADNLTLEFALPGN